MKYRANTTVESDYLRITASGEYFFEDLPEFIGFVKAEAVAAQRSRVLIDCLALGGNMTEGERFEGGRLVADVFGPNLWAALLLPPHFITKLGELAAANRGAKFLVTSSESEALDWLRQD